MPEGAQAGNDVTRVLPLHVARRPDQASEGQQMTRVAVVSGGSRGIGAAISKALQAAGYKVAANYAGNDAVAAKFEAETGIPVYKWDGEGLKKVSEDLGPSGNHPRRHAPQDDAGAMVRGD